VVAVTMLKRLERLTPALSVKERFLMALEEYRAGRPPAVDLGDLSPAELEEWHAYSGPVMGVNLLLSALAPVVEGRVDWLESDLARIDAIDEVAEELERRYDEPRVELPRNWRKLREVTAPAVLRALAREQREEVGQSATELLQELEAARAVGAEVAKVVGREIVRTEAEDQVKRVDEAVRGLRSRLGLTRPPRPNAAFTEHFRQVVAALAGAEEVAS
jgi:hypothetical protein